MANPADSLHPSDPAQAASAGASTQPDPQAQAPVAPPPPGTPGEASTVAILGFSSSGKTVYLTMLYYQTDIRGEDGSTSSGNSIVSGDSGYRWRADWLNLDQGKTLNYLVYLYKQIVGLAYDGRRMFKPGSRKEVIRSMPVGTQEHQEIMFRLFCHNGIREHVLDIRTLEGAGEVLQAYAANPYSIDVAFRPRWEQFKSVCSNADAILLFFNLLKMEIHDDQGPFKTLIDTLVNQPKKPRAIAIVITGTDILPDEREVELRKQKFINEYQRGLAQLTAHKIPWEVFMVTSYGRSFTRQKPQAEISDSCREPTHYRCKECQELVPDVEARPDPKDLLKPWDFIYEKCYHSGDWHERLKALGELMGKFKYLLMAAAFLVLFAIVAIAAVLTKQKERSLENLLASTPLTESKVDAAALLDRELRNGLVSRVFSANPAKLSETHPRYQLLQYLEVRDAINNKDIPLATRVSEAERAVGQLKSPFVEMVPLEKLKLERDLSGITRVKGDTLALWNSWPKRIQVADAAFANSDRSPAAKEQVEKAINELLGEIGSECDKAAREIERRASSENPGKGDDIARAEALLQLLQEMDKNQIGRTDAARDLLKRLNPVRKDLILLADYQRIGEMPEQSADQVLAKQKAYEKFGRQHSAHPIATASTSRETELKERVAGMRAGEAFKSLPEYDTSLVVKDLPKFVEIYTKVKAFIANYGKSDEVESARNRLQQMKDDLDSELGRIQQQTTDELSLFKQRPPRKLQGFELEDARYRLVQGRLDGLKNLSRVAEDTKIASKLSGLEELVGIQKEYLALARIVDGSPADDSQRQAIAESLRSFAKRLSPDHPARLIAESEQSAIDMRIIYNRIQGAFDKLPKPDTFTVETGDLVFNEVLSSYNSFLKSGEGLLVSASKKEKFAEFLAAANLSSPLQDGLKSRNSIQARFEERKLWAQIGEAFVDPDRRLGREETLKLIERFDKSYPESTLQKELTRRRNSIEAWRKVSYRYGIEIETPKGFYELTLMVRAEKGSQNLARTVTPVIAGNASAPEFSFSAWSDQALEIVVEVRRQGDKLPIYYQRRSLSAGQFEDEISRAFPTENGFRVRLSPR